MAKSNSGLYYKKDKKCDIVKETLGYGVFDPHFYTYVSKSPLWCYACQLSQDQVYEAKSYGEAETRYFVLNYRNDVEVGDYVEYRGKFYVVTRVDTKDDYNGELFVYVKDCPTGNIPTGVVRPS